MEEFPELFTGDTIEVTIKREVAKPGGGLEKEQTVDKGEVCAVPSRKFDWSDDDFDFDYKLILPTSESGAIRSVDIENEVVCQLMYDSGFDRDWDTFQLLDIKRIG